MPIQVHLSRMLKRFIDVVENSIRMVLLLIGNNFERPGKLRLAKLPRRCDAQAL